MIYDNFLILCNECGKTPSAVALEMGLSKTSVNRWKNGGGVTDATALKIANYFGITVDELKNGIKNKPTAVSDEPVNEAVDSAKVELVNLFESLSIDNKALVLQIARGLAQNQADD